jgi:hypothetical protein
LNPLRRVGFSLAVVLLIIYEGAMFQITKRHFRGKATVDTSISAQFSPGQILVLMMIVPMVTDYIYAFVGKSYTRESGY